MILNPLFGIAFILCLSETIAFIELRWKKIIFSHNMKENIIIINILYFPLVYFTNSNELI